MFEAFPGAAEGVNIPVRDHTKGPDGRQHAALVAVQFAQPLPRVLNQFSLQAARQVHAVRKRIERVAFPVFSLVALTSVRSPAGIVDGITLVVAGGVMVAGINAHGLPPVTRRYTCADGPSGQWAERLVRVGIRSELARGQHSWRAVRWRLASSGTARYPAGVDGERSALRLL